MDCRCNYIHQRPVLGGRCSGRGPKGPSEALLPHFMSPASSLLGLRKEVGDPLKGEAPLLPTSPLWLCCTLGVGAGPRGAGLGSHSHHLGHLGGCAFDVKIKIHPVLSVACVCISQWVWGAEALGGQTDSQWGLGPTLLGKRGPSLAFGASSVGGGGGNHLGCVSGQFCCVSFIILSVTS